MELGSGIVVYEQYKDETVARLQGLVTRVRSNAADRLPDVAFRADRLSSWINQRLKQIRAAVNYIPPKSKSQ